MISGELDAAAADSKTPSTATGKHFAFASSSSASRVVKWRPRCITSRRAFGCAGDSAGSGGALPRRSPGVDGVSRRCTVPGSHAEQPGHMPSGSGAVRRSRDVIPRRGGQSRTGTIESALRRSQLAQHRHLSARSSETTPKQSACSNRPSTSCGHCGAASTPTGCRHRVSPRRGADTRRGISNWPSTSAVPALSIQIAALPSPHLQTADSMALLGTISSIWVISRRQSPISAMPKRWSCALVGEAHLNWLPSGTSSPASDSSRARGSQAERLARLALALQRQKLVETHPDIALSRRCSIASGTRVADQVLFSR